MTGRELKISENRGKKRSISTIFESHRKAEWEQFHSDPGEYRPIVMKGCGDHESALVSKLFEEKILSSWKVRISKVSGLHIHFRIGC